MKTPHKSTSLDQPDFHHLANLLASAHLLEEKTRINLYLPKAVVQIMDAMATNQSRSQLVKNLVVDKVKKPKIPTSLPPDPYGMLADSTITDADIDEVTKSWDKHVDKLMDEQ